MMRNPEGAVRLLTLSDIAAAPSEAPA